MVKWFKEMDAEHWQLLCRVLGTAFGILALLALFGNDYFGKQIEKGRRVAAAQNSDAQSTKLTDIQSTQRELLAALAAREKSIEASLWDEFPFGYVLFGTDRGDLLSLPLKTSSADGMKLHVDADWARASIKVAADGRSATVRVPKLDWWVEGQGGVRMHGSELNATFPLERGKATRVRAPFSVTGQPAMFFEVLDPNPEKPVFVIGFKIPSQDNLDKLGRRP
jgi:hypothetical protein